LREVFNAQVFIFLAMVYNAFAILAAFRYYAVLNFSARYRRDVARGDGTTPDFTSKKARVRKTEAKQYFIAQP
jgi:hypothetical protein